MKHDHVAISGLASALRGAATATAAEQQGVGGVFAARRQVPLARMAGGGGPTAHSTREAMPAAVSSSSAAAAHTRSVVSGADSQVKNI